MTNIKLKHHKNPELYFNINMFSLEYFMGFKLYFI